MAHKKVGKRGRPGNFVHPKKFRGHGPNRQNMKSRKRDRIANPKIISSMRK